MTITAAQLVPFHAQNVTDDDTCGGRISFNAITSGSPGCTHGHVFKAKRAAGNVAYPDCRKIFYRNCNPSGEVAYAPGLFLFRPNPSSAWVYKVVGTQRNTRADLTGSEARYGAGLLASAVLANATTLVVNVKHADLAACFAVGRPTRISNRALASSTTGTEEEVTPTAVSVAGLQVTLTIPAPGVANPYSAGATVFSVYYPGSELQCVVDNYSESGGNLFDEATFPVVGDNLGTAEETWTVTRLTDTTFSCVGDTIGALDNGSTGADYAPINPANNMPWFTLPAAGWLGALPSGYSLSFQTHPPAISVFEFRVIPPDCPSLAGDGITLGLDIESI
jgi:hypothetical protein